MFDLRDAEDEWVHRTEDVESHLLCREHSDTVRLELLGDQTGGVHETSAAGPSGKQVRKAVKKLVP